MWLETGFLSDLMVSDCKKKLKKEMGSAQNSCLVSYNLPWM